MHPAPAPLAILLCDQIIIEEKTKKKTLVGIFENLSGIFPALRPIGFYAKLTDAEGSYKFKVRIVKMEDNMPVAVLETGEAKVENRLINIELALNLPPVPFPSPGRYEFQLFANDVYLGRAVLEAKKREG